MTRNTAGQSSHAMECIGVRAIILEGADRQCTQAVLNPTAAPPCFTVHGTRCLAVLWGLAAAHLMHMIITPTNKIRIEKTKPSDTTYVSIVRGPDGASCHLDLCGFQSSSETTAFISAGTICFLRESTPGSTAMPSSFTVTGHACSTSLEEFGEAEMKVASCGDSVTRAWQEGGSGISRGCRISVRGGLVQHIHDEDKHIIDLLLNRQLPLRRHQILMLS